ncbi:MAG: PilZ domain-containing protein [Pseudomonadota bacterium]
MSSDENRRSFRVSEDIYIQHEMITDEEFQAGMEHFKLRRGITSGSAAKLVDVEARLSEAMYLMNGENSAFGRVLVLMNEKLNVAIEELPGFRETKSSLAKQPPQKCELSADGLVFSSESIMHEGDKIYLRMLLSSDNRFVESFCRVVRIAEAPDTSDPNRNHGIAVEFVKMPPAQREILIQHMFSLESETLRMRRLQLDEEEVEKLQAS